MQSQLSNRSTPVSPKQNAWPYPVRLDGQQSILSQIPWHIALPMRLRILWASLWRIVCIIETEMGSSIHRISVRLHKMECLPIPSPSVIDLSHIHPSLNNWKPASIDYIRQVQAEKPWASLFDLSLCLDGWEAAVESCRRHIEDSCRAQTNTQKSDSRNS